MLAMVSLQLGSCIRASRTQVLTRQSRNGTTCNIEYSYLFAWRSSNGSERFNSFELALVLLSIITHLFQS